MNVVMHSLYLFSALAHHNKNNADHRVKRCKIVPTTCMLILITLLIGMTI